MVGRLLNIVIASVNHFCHRELCLRHIAVQKADSCLASLLVNLFTRVNTPSISAKAQLQILLKKLMNYHLVKSCLHPI